MRKVNNLPLIVYLAIILVVFVLLVSPIFIQPENLSPTQIPAYNVQQITLAKRALSSYGKQVNVQATEPDLNTFVFGGKDPL